MSKLIYIAGPYEGGDTIINVRNAIDMAMKLNDNGHACIVPHLNHFVHMLYPRPRSYWMGLCRNIVPYCDTLLRLVGDSPGADEETELAEECGMEVIEELKLRAKMGGRGGSL